MNRRRFVHVLAASGAALLAGSLPRARAAEKSATAAATRAAARQPKPLPPNLERDLRNQEKSMADTLRVIRAYDLPPGSEPATVFRAMRARRR
jgi:hypothetical protein